MADQRSTFLQYDSLLSAKYRVTITGYGPNEVALFTVKGTTQSDFSIGGGNTYEDRGDVANELLNSNSVTATFNTARNFVGKGQAALQGSNRTLLQKGSELSWMGSKAPSFSIDLTFVCLDSSDPRESVVRRVTQLLRAVYPDVNKGDFFTPPMGYSIEKSNAGKVKIKIGKWFSGDKMIIEDIQFAYGKEMNSRGEPITAQGNITFRPFRTVSYSEVQKWFKIGK